MKLSQRLLVGAVSGAGALVLAVALTRQMDVMAAAIAPPVEQQIGGGAPSRVLIDNESMRVTLVAFPEGFIREGGQRRRLEQLIVYLEPGEFEVVGARSSTPAAPRVAGPESPITPEGKLSDSGVHPPGTVAWHPEGSLTATLKMKRAYRALYIETKN